MKFLIKVSKDVEKFVQKLDKSLKIRTLKAIKELAKKPFPTKSKHIIETLGSSMLCELPIDKLRIYYTIEKKYLIIEKIEYKGKIEVIKAYQNHKSGNKKNNPNQRRDISKLKKWFLKLFKK